MTRTLHLLGVFFAAWLLMPGIPAMIGIAPSPPEKPIIGYGADPGPFDTTMTIHPYLMPEEVELIIMEQEQDIEFSVYLTLPELSEDLPLDSIPLALISHGWGYPVYEEYTDWISHLSAKGMAVAFIQHPSHIDPPIPEGLTGIDVEGASNYPHHEYRAIAIASALDTLQDIALNSSRHQTVDLALGNVTINPDKSLIFICLAISSAASKLVSNAVLSIFFCLIELPEFISIETRASVGLITKYPPEFNLISESKI